MKPHPTKSKPRIAKPSPRQPGKGERVMYENVFGEITNDPTHGGGWDTPVLILDLSDEARERRVEAGAKAIYNSSYHSEGENPFVLKLRKAVHGKAPTWERLVKECGPNGIVGNCRAKARAVLTALGDTPAGEGRGK